MRAGQVMMLLEGTAEEGTMAELESRRGSTRKASLCSLEVASEQRHALCHAQEQVEEHGGR